MIVLSNLAANLALNEDTITKYACLTESEAQLGLALSAKENISTLRPLDFTIQNRLHYGVALSLPTRKFYCEMCR